MKFSILFIFLPSLLFNLQMAHAQKNLPFIFAGQEVLADDPVALSTVRIQIQLTRSSITCTGTLISEDVVLTAAHCVGPDWAKKSVFLAKNKNPIAVSRYIAHENYSEHIPTNIAWNDIALLKLTKPVDLPYRPAMLPQSSDSLATGQVVLLAGFGQNTPVPRSLGSSRNPTLRKIEQKILNPDYLQTEFLVNIKDGGSCFGDSGGPAYIQSETGLIVRGLTSHLTEKDLISGSSKHKTYACLEEMVYTNVSAMTEWIEESLVQLSR